MSFTPLHDRVLVCRIEGDETTVSGRLTRQSRHLLKVLGWLHWAQYGIAPFPMLADAARKSIAVVSRDAAWKAGVRADRSDFEMPVSELQKNCHSGNLHQEPAWSGRSIEKPICPTYMRSRPRNSRTWLMRLPWRPIAHLFFGNRAFSQTDQAVGLVPTIDFRIHYRERTTYGLFAPQEAVGFERVSRKTGQAPALAIQLEPDGNAAFEEGYVWHACSIWEVVMGKGNKTAIQVG